MPSVYSSTETANQVASAFSPMDERNHLRGFHKDCTGKHRQGAQCLVRPLEVLKDMELGIGGAIGGKHNKTLILPVDDFLLKMSQGLSLSRVLRNT